MLRKPTEWYRATVDSNGRVVVQPECGAARDPFAVRKITLIIPSGADVFIGLDKEPVSSAKMKQAGWSEAPDGKGTYFNILAHQWISAVVEDQNVEMSVIVEYL